jgi:hypothetical protein
LPPLRPKRSALRAPQGSAPGKAAIHKHNKHHKPKTQKGDISNED